MLRRNYHFTLMAAAGDGGAGGGGADDSVEVDVPGGVKLKLPKDTAAKVIAGRDADKQARRELEIRVGAIEAEKNAADAARVKAETEKAALEHTKKGEFDKATELLTKTHRDREAKIAAQLRDKALRAAVATAKNVAPTAIDDICDQLRARSSYDFDADAVVVLDAAGQPLKDDSGKPVQVDAWLGSFLEKRPHFLLDGTPKGTGADGGPKKTPSAKVITEKQVEAMSPMDRAKFFEANPEAKVVG